MPDPAPAKRVEPPRPAPKPFAEMTPADMEAWCAAKPKDAAGTMLALFHERTAELPDTMFVRRGKDAFTRKARMNVRLTVSAGHLQQVGSKFMITAEGYRRLNMVAGLVVIAPNLVVAGNQTQPNPFIETTPDGQATRAIARKIVVGASPLTGALVATDITLRLDLGVYMLEALSAKVTKLNDINVGSIAMRNDGPQDKAGWTFIPIGTIGDMGLWINTRAKAITDVIGQHITRIKFCERLAQTMCERNAFKAHPAMPSSVQVQGDVAIVPMTGWVRSETEGDIENLRTAINNGTIRDYVADVDAKEVEPDDEGRASGEDALRDASEAEGGRAQDDEDANKKVDVDGLRAQAAERFAERQNTQGAKPAKAELAKAGIDKLMEATPEQMQAYLKATAG